MVEAWSILEYKHAHAHTHSHAHTHARTLAHRLPASPDPEVFAAQRTMVEAWSILEQTFVDGTMNSQDWPVRRGGTHTHTHTHTHTIQSNFTDTMFILAHACMAQRTAKTSR